MLQTHLNPIDCPAVGNVVSDGVLAFKGLLGPGIQKSDPERIGEVTILSI